MKSAVASFQLKGGKKLRDSAAIAEWAAIALQIAHADDDPEWRRSAGR